MCIGSHRRSSGSECEDVHCMAAKRCTFRGDTAPCSQVLFGDDGTQCKGKGGKDAPMPSGVEDSLLPSSLAKCPQILKGTPLFITVLPRLGISPQGTIKPAVQRVLCEDVHHSLFIKVGIRKRFERTVMGNESFIRRNSV